MELSRTYTAEVGVLGSLLIEPDALAGRVFRQLRPEDFADPALRHIFEAARRLHLDRKPVDAVTVCAEAGAAYDKLIAEIMQRTPTAANYEAYEELLISQSRLAALQRFAAAILDADSYEQGLAALSKAEGLLTQRPGRRASTYAEMISDYLDRQQNGRQPDYLDFGIEALNSRVHISPGRFVILGADSSIGKTAFAFQLAYNMARSGKRIGFFSYETSRPDSIDRILANVANIALPLSKAKRLSLRDIKAAADEGARADGIALTLIESSEYTVDDLRAETIAGGYDVIFVDYVQLVPSGTKRDRYQEVTAASMALHSMAQRLGVTVIALSQVTPPDRDKKGQRPPLTKESLRESRQLVNDADAILLMDLYDPSNRDGLRILDVAKNKDGTLGRMYMRFDAVHMRFTPTPPPPGESYRKTQGEIAAAKRALREEARQQAAGKQVTFEELPADDGQDLPFEI